MAAKTRFLCALALAGVVPLVAACSEGTTSTTLEGEDGYALDVLQLDGSNTLAFPADPRFEPAAQSTIEFWVRPEWTSDPGFDPVVIANAGPEGPSYMVSVLGNRDGMAVMSGAALDTFPFDFADGKMHHVALIDYGDKVSALIDNEPHAELDLTFQPLPSDGLYVGSAHGGDDGFTGAIGGLRIWDVAVDPAQIAAYRMHGVNDPEQPHPDLAFLAAASDFGRDTVVLMDR